MRIAIVTPYPPSQGSLNEYAFHFIRFLRQKPEVREIFILSDRLPDDATYPAETASPPGLAPLHIVPCWRFGALDNALRIVRTARDLAPDIVLFNIQFASFGSSKPAAALGLLAPAMTRAAGIPAIVLLHNIMETVDLKSAGFGANPLVEWFIRAFGAITTRALLSADLLAVTIPRYVEILEHKYGAANVLLAPHGAFDEAPPPSFDPPPGPLQIMTFGKFGTYKKIEPLVDAFRLLSETRRDLELVIAGTDSPNAPGYLESVRLANVDLAGLRFTGYVAEEDVPRIFQDAGVVVFPYTSTTGSSGVLHQAGNYGRAVVLPRLGDLAELIAEEGYTGEFFTPENAQSLAEALARLLDDPARRRAMGTQNYLAACGLPMAEVVEWYILHAQNVLTVRNTRRAARRREFVKR